MMLSIYVNSAHNNNKYAITYMSAGVMNRENDCIWASFTENVGTLHLDCLVLLFIAVPSHSLALPPSRSKGVRDGYAKLNLD